MATTLAGSPEVCPSASTDQTDSKKLQPSLTQEIAPIVFKAQESQDNHDGLGDIRPPTLIHLFKKVYRDR